MNDNVSPITTEQAETDRKPGNTALIKWFMMIGVLTLVLAPVATLKLAEWKIKQDEASKAELVANGIKTDHLNFGGPFSLIDQDGKSVTEAAFRGKNLLVYFGYTYCPDLCPTALQNITETLNELGPDAKDVQVLFITVDPERDTPEKLKTYVSSFDPKIVGLTGTPQQIASVAKAYGVTYSKAEIVEGNDYMMDHSTLMYVLNKAGKPVASMDMEQVDPGIIANLLRRLWMLPKGS